MTLLKNAREVSVSEATQRGVAGLVADAEQGSDVIVTRRHQAVAAVVSILKKVLLLVDDAQAGYPLGGELTGFRKLVVGRNT
jgi:antitoxin (DNA-binding transcriptional repressor) of toxin-antitoxin stability system